MGCSASSAAPPAFSGDVDEYSYFREKGDKMASGEWRSGLKDKDASPSMGAASMVFTVKGIPPNAGGDEKSGGVAIALARRQCH